MFEKLKIGIFADADFSAAEAAAKASGQRIQASLGEAGKGQSLSKSMFGGEPATIETALRKIQGAIRQTGQAGKAFSDIEFPTGKFKDATNHLNAMKDRLEQMRKTSFGKSVINRMESFGHDSERFWEWDWKRAYKDPKIGAFNRNRFFHGADLRSSERMGLGHTVLEGMGLRAGVGAMGRAAGGAALARTGGMAAQAGMGGALGGVGIAGVAGAAVGGGVVAGLWTAFSKGHSEFLQSMESVDSISRALGESFKGLQDKTGHLGSELELSAAQASALSKTFIQTAGASDSGAIARAEFAGLFGRGYGLDPNSSAQQFAKAELVGTGNTKQEQRDLASAIAMTLESSGMQARTEQVMSEMVAQIAQIASSQKREATAAEFSRYGEMLGATYQNPALRGGTGTAMLNQFNALGSGGGEQGEAFSWYAYSNAVGGDPYRVQRLQQAPLTTTPRELFNDPSLPNITKAELIHEAVKVWAQGMPGGTPKEQYGYTFAQMTGGEITTGQELYSVMEERWPQERGKARGFLDYAGQFGDISKLNPSGMNVLADIYGGLGDRSEERKDELKAIGQDYLDSGELSASVADKLKTILSTNDPTEALEQYLPRLAFETGAIKSEAAQYREATANLSNSLAELGEHIVPLTTSIKNLAVKATGILDAMTGSGKGVIGAPGQDMGERNIMQTILGGVMDVARTPITAPTTMAIRGARDLMAGKTPEATEKPADINKSPLTSALLGKTAEAKANPLPSPGGKALSSLPSPKTGLSSVPAEAATKARSPQVDDREQLLREIEEKHGLPKGLMSGIRDAETSPSWPDEKRDAAVSGAGAKGPFQFMPGTWEDHGTGNPEDVYNFPRAAEAAGGYLSWMRDYLKNNGVEPTPENLAAAYNAGPGAVVKHGGVPPFKETQGYVGKVQGLAGESSVTPKGLDGVEQRFDPSFHFGKTATRSKKPFEGVVFHHTSAESKHDAEWLADYGNRVDKGRGGAFGYHLLIDRDGQVVQAAPFDKRTNHIASGSDTGLSNRNAIGISLVGAEGGRETEAQIESAKQVYKRLLKEFPSIDPSKVYGHGEIQSNRQEGEGKLLAEMLRAPKPDVPKMHTGGLVRPDSELWPAMNRDEVPRILQVGEEVLTASDPRHIGNQPKMPDELQRLVNTTMTPTPAQARWDGQIAMDVTFRNERGQIVKRTHSLAVGEPRMAGTNGNRFQWNDDVVMPS